MNKTAFMNDLSDKLDRLSEDDRKEYLEFFSEIIDDKIEEDGLTVIDFKTDRVSDGGEGEKAREHALQLALYAKAAEEIFGLPVKEKWVWFLRKGIGVEV